MFKLPLPGEVHSLCHLFCGWCQLWAVRPLNANSSPLQRCPKRASGESLALGPPPARRARRGNPDGQHTGPFHSQSGTSGAHTERVISRVQPIACTPVHCPPVPALSGLPGKGALQPHRPAGPRMPRGTCEPQKAPAGRPARWPLSCSWQRKSKLSASF